MMAIRILDPRCSTAAAAAPQLMVSRVKYILGLLGLPTKRNDSETIQELKEWHRKLPLEKDDEDYKYRVEFQWIQSWNPHLAGSQLVAKKKQQDRASANEPAHIATNRPAKAKPVAATASVGKKRHQRVILKMTAAQSLNLKILMPSLLMHQWLRSVQEIQNFATAEDESISRNCVLAHL